MIFALLGDILIGGVTWTGPTTVDESAEATLAKLKVARGKPVVQDMGDELAAKKLDFFFDETFCNPEVELTKLIVAFETRLPLAYVAGHGAFRGVRYIIEKLSAQTKKTTPNGRPTRIEVKLEMLETPELSPLNFFAQIAREGATALAAVENVALMR